MSNKARVTVAQINHGGLQHALLRIAAEGHFNPRTAYQIMKMKKAVDRALVDARELFNKLIERHAELDEQGKVKAFPDEKMAFKIKAESKAAYDKEINELMALELELEPQLHIVALEGGIKLSPQEIEFLIPIVDMESPAGPRAV